METQSLSVVVSAVNLLLLIGLLFLHNRKEKSDRKRAEATLEQFKSDFVSVRVLIDELRNAHVQAINSAASQETEHFSKVSESVTSAKSSIEQAIVAIFTQEAEHFSKVSDNIASGRNSVEGAIAEIAEKQERSLGELTRELDQMKASLEEATTL